MREHYRRVAGSLTFGKMSLSRDAVLRAASRSRCGQEQPHGEVYEEYLERLVPFNVVI